MPVGALQTRHWGRRRQVLGAMTMTTTLVRGGPSNEAATWPQATAGSANHNKELQIILVCSISENWFGT
jgi:hypothetical protein